MVQLEAMGGAHVIAEHTVKWGFSLTFPVNISCCFSNVFVFFFPSLSWLLKLSYQFITLKKLKKVPRVGKEMLNGHICSVLDNMEEGFSPPSKAKLLS